MPSRLSRRLPSRAPEGLRVRTRSPRSRPSTASQSSAEGSCMRRRLSLGLLCLTLAACTQKADVIITDGMVWTGLSTGAPRRGSVAIADGKILAIGDDSDVGRYAGPKTQRIQANGGLVLPGFTDGHTHFIDGGFQLAPVNLRDGATPPGVVRRLQQYPQTPKPGDWIH